jgi:cytoskeleton protein RodZ
MTDEIESLGHYLRRERERRNISLKEVASNTRVREYFLRAMEEDRYDLLPASTFVKGFLHSYARYLGLDPNEILLRFQDALKGDQPSVLPPPPDKKRLGRKKLLWFGLAVMVGGGIGFGLIFSYLFLPHPAELPVESVPSKPEVTTVAPSLPAPPVAAETTGTPEEKSFSLQMKAVERTWIRIQLDQQPDQEIMLQPGEFLSYQGVHRIQILVGNAGGLDVTLNGKTLERFGKSGEVVTLTVTPQGTEVKRSEEPTPPME